MDDSICFHPTAKIWRIYGGRHDVNEAFGSSCQFDEGRFEEKSC